MSDLAKSTGRTRDDLKGERQPPTLTENDLWYVIEYKDLDVGFFWIRLESPTEAFGYHMHVDEEYRNQGIGKIAMQGAQSILAEQGIKKIKLCVFQENKVAHQIYKGFGFQEAEFNEDRSQYTLEIEI